MMYNSLNETEILLDNIETVALAHLRFVMIALTINKIAETFDNMSLDDVAFLIRRCHTFGTMHCGRV